MGGFYGVEIDPGHRGFVPETSVTKSDAGSTSALALAMQVSPPQLQLQPAPQLVTSNHVQLGGTAHDENKLAFFTEMGVKIPIAVSAFPDEIYQAPRSWVERAYPKLIHYNQLPKGGHFAAWEQPKYFVDELRVSFKNYRDQ